MNRHEALLQLFQARNAVAVPGSSTHQQIGKVSHVRVSQPVLNIEVGYTDREGSQVDSRERAHSARDTLVDAGLDACRVSLRGMGNTRPLVSNRTARGKEGNRRVENVITGNSIGVPVRDHSDPISRSRLWMIGGKTPAARKAWGQSSIRPSMALMPCVNREILFARYRAQLRVWMDAIYRLDYTHNRIEFERVSRQAEHSRLAFNRARQEFNSHTAEHGCIT